MDNPAPVLVALGPVGHDEIPIFRERGRVVNTVLGLVVEGWATTEFSIGGAGRGFASGADGAESDSGGIFDFISFHDFFLLCVSMRTPDFGLRNFGGDGGGNVGQGFREFLKTTTTKLASVQIKPEFALIEFVFISSGGCIADFLASECGAGDVATVVVFGIQAIPFGQVVEINPAHFVFGPFGSEFFELVDLVCIHRFVSLIVPSIYLTLGYVKGKQGRVSIFNKG
jgi:hypothetical protein